LSNWLTLIPSADHRLAATTPTDLILPAGGLILNFLREIGGSLLTAPSACACEAPCPTSYQEKRMKIELTPEARAFIQDRGGEITLAVLSVGG